MKRTILPLAILAMLASCGDKDTKNPNCERFLPKHMDAFDRSIARSLGRTAVVRITLTEPPIGKQQYDSQGEEM